MLESSLCCSVGLSFLICWGKDLSALRPHTARSLRAAFSLQSKPPDVQAVGEGFDSEDEAHPKSSALSIPRALTVPATINMHVASLHQQAQMVWGQAGEGRGNPPGGAFTPVPRRGTTPKWFAKNICPHVSWMKY